MAEDLLIERFLGNEVARTIRMRCPHCRHNSRLEPLFNSEDRKLLLADQRIVGIGNRFCPDEQCGQVIYVVYEIEDDGHTVITSAPSEVLELDPTGLPPKVLAAIEEAATCHSNGCYMAAAIMIRKTLEEVCADQNATGPNLRDRVAALKTSVVLPKALLDGLDSLRLLGNDAAHIESKTFDEVGQEEVTISFDVVKEVLKAVYQYENLLTRLNALKK